MICLDRIGRTVIKTLANGGRPHKTEPTREVSLSPGRGMRQQTDALCL